MTSDREDILALEVQRCRAELDRDIVQLDKMLDDELIYVHASGIVEGKATLLPSRKHLEWLKLDRSDLTVHLSGDTAVMTGIISSEARRSDSPDVIIMTSFATQMLVRRADGWKFTLIHATQLKNEGLSTA